MVLVFVTPIQDPPHLFFGFLPSRTVVHTILFLGFTHTTLGTLKKQLKYDKLRDNAAIVVIGIGLAIALISEVSMYLFGVKAVISPWSILFDILGIALGIGTFKILYRSCC